jgi:hypothetical protein
MAYRPFYASVSDSTPATVATVATVGAQTSRSVANVATVARGHVRTRIEPGPKTAPGPSIIAKPLAVPRLSLEDNVAAFEERAAILEYDEGLPREEAERLAREQTRHLLQ